MTNEEKSELIKGYLLFVSEHYSPHVDVSTCLRSDWLYAIEQYLRGYLK